MRSLVLCLLLLPSLALGQEGQEGPKRPAKGMSIAEVEAILGKADHVSRQVFAHGCLEHWMYTGRRLRVVFDCPRGRPPRVEAVRETGARK